MTDSWEKIISVELIKKGATPPKPPASGPTPGGGVWPPSAPVPPPKK